MATEKPKRCFEVTIKIGADSWDDVIAEIDHLHYYIEVTGPSCRSVSGSPSSNHSVSIDHQPEMTHEIYHQQLKSFIEEMRDAREVEN